MRGYFFYVAHNLLRVFENEDIELDEPGVMPDCLQPIGDDGVLHVGEALTVLWVEVKVDYSGDLKNIINFTDQYGKVIETCFDIRVIQKELPGKSFFYAQYIDPHSLSDTYGVPLFSSSFWDIFEKHVAMAVDHRVNTMLVPAYPIHYDDGIQYKSVQLVDIIYEGTQYTFNYDLLDSWLLILHRNGIKRIILPPIFPSFRDFKCPNFRCQKEYFMVDSTSKIS